ncbi:LptF/LptG family permease [Teichococcus aestuarii]|uniref:LptF/LptG family permease n=1 Tax=Teichococcus aestuarii TaxID=568898 RepID=UPI0036127433
MGELLHPDPEENLPERDIRKFRAEGHQRLSSPFTALSFAMVGLATALASGFRRHGDWRPATLGVGLVVVLLALGLAVGNRRRATTPPSRWSGRRPWCRG